MEREMMISGGGMIRRLRLPRFEETDRTQVAGAGMLCGGDGKVYCNSDEENVIWQMDKRTLAPLALFASGPGVGQMILSGDASRLYVMLSDADSILLMHAATGTPLFLARAGANPQQMALDERRNTLAVAGGGSARVHVFEADTLQPIREIQMPGFVCSVVIQPCGGIAALCMNGDTKSMLVRICRNGRKAVSVFPGSPGALAVCSGAVYAATEQRLTRLDCADGKTILRIPGRAGFLRVWSPYVFYTDQYRQKAYAADLQSGRVLQIPGAAIDLMV